jgi:ABC-2 type transport system ATP-binding protein
MLTTLLFPTSGTFSINGFSQDQVHDVRRSFGIVFQDPSLDDDLSAEENLMFHAALYGVSKVEAAKKATEVLELVELSDRRKDYVKTFSGGMKRRLEIARSLMHIPAVLFLDEPTVGLDPQTRNKMWDYLRKLKKESGETVLFTTHYMEEVERAADIVFIIDHGNIIAKGTVDEIKHSMGAKTLEEAFLKLTGAHIRKDEAKSIDRLRGHAKMWGRR